MLTFAFGACSLAVRASLLVVALLGRFLLTIEAFVFTVGTYAEKQDQLSANKLQMQANMNPQIGNTPRGLYSPTVHSKYLLETTF